MKPFYAMSVGIFFANAVIQMAAGLKCSSGCAACWLDNNSHGVDTKFACGGDKGEHCNDVCPTGYNGIHCAAVERCVCTRGPYLACHAFGPCQCGYTSSEAYLTCQPLDATGSCQTD